MVYTREQVILAASAAINFSSFARLLGISINSNATIKRILKEHKADISHFVPPVSRIDDDLVFVENSGYARNLIKQRLIKSGDIKYICNICGIGPVWNGAPMVLILDHINGINNDNRKDNLRFVCSNCDSQLSTYKSRNRKRVMEDS